MRAAKGPGLMAFCLDVGPVLVVGYVVFTLICGHLLDYYRIDSPSMEPGLHGDPRYGDVVLVDKTAFWSSPPEEFDVVVIAGAKAGDNHIVKRVAVVASDRDRDVSIDPRGDLWRSADPGGELTRLTKHPKHHADLRVTLFEYPHPVCAQPLEEALHLPLSATADPTGVTLRPAVESADELPTVLGQRRKTGPAETLRIPEFLATQKPVSTAFLRINGRLSKDGEQRFVADIGLEMDLDTGDASALAFVFEYRGLNYSLIWARDGAVTLLLPGKAPNKRRAEAQARMPVQVKRLAFGYLDGYLFLVHEGAVVFYEELSLTRPMSLRENGLHFGAAAPNGSTLRIDRVRIFHDLPLTQGPPGAYGPGDRRTVLPAGHMFLLGDNTFQSSDSRGDLGLGTVPLKRLIGRPCLILAPPLRRGSLAR